MTNLNPAYYYQFNPFFDISGNTGTPSLQLLTVNPIYGTVNVALQYSTSANFGYGSPEFISNNWTTVYQCWNWAVGTNSAAPFNTPAPAGYSYYCTNNLTAYSLVESNIAMVTFNSGLTLMDDTWINTLWTESINPSALTTVGDTLAQSIVVGPAGTVNYSSYNNGWGPFIQTPMVSFPSVPGDLPGGTNVIGTTGDLLLIESAPGLLIELEPGGTSMGDFYPDGSFHIGPGGRYYEALQMSATSNLTLLSPGEYIGNGRGLTNLQSSNLVGSISVAGYGSTATNTYSMTSTGYTNTGTKNIRIFDLTGLGLVFSNALSTVHFAMTNTAYPFVVISPNESITGTGCQASALVDF
jgi:hypothetical protein